MNKSRGGKRRGKTSSSHRLPEAERKWEEGTGLAMLCHREDFRPSFVPYYQWNPRSLPWEAAVRIPMLSNYFWCHLFIYYTNI